MLGQNNQICSSFQKCPKVMTNMMVKKLSCGIFTLSAPNISLLAVKGVTKCDFISNAKLTSKKLKASVNMLITLFNLSNKQTLQ